MLEFLMSSPARFAVLAVYVVAMGGCGSVTARTDGAATGGSSGTDAGRAGTDASGTGGAGTGGAGTGGSGGAAGAGSCHVELLQNGDFEAGNVGWTASPSDRRLIYLFGEVNPTVVPPTESDYIAWLGYDVVNQTVVLSQTIQIPASTVSITVSGSVYVQTDENGTPYDFGYVETVIPARTDPEMSWSNANAGSGWVPFSVTRPQNGLAGQAATFRLRVVMDDAVNTSFFFDNLSFVANLCP
jgi:hypothetical protein